MVAWILVMMLVAGGTAASSASAEAPLRTVTDTAGRVVELPGAIARVATVGAVPIMNSFILALGKGDSIVNGVPPFSQSKAHRMLRLLAPPVFRQPVAQGPAGDPNVEVLTKLHPDLVLTMERARADLLEHEGLAALVLRGRNPEDIKTTMALLGDVLGARDRAARYVQYFDEKTRRIDAVVATIPEAQRPKVLFFSLKSMSQPHQIDEWWIRRAGGVSVTAFGGYTENQSISVEQLLAWNPDILVVNVQPEIAKALQDERLQTLEAVRTKRVYTVPVGVHVWHRSVEQPLALLWAAKTFFPERLGALDLAAETKRFYGEFFDYRLTDEQVNEILSGVQ
jgi:iron complex transport system substrate-binding protein